ncbi:MAG: hypothetical protein IPN91_14210 [Holophagaceae bacterium]|uniref:Uncharacterized protein n=1 Tax=Candidatus Geothrix odensensis TaxID=2954440 RepID=A0A936K6G6_9BACT|nr:hypothetical protein [Candidatus Geothrix odensensis]
MLTGGPTADYPVKDASPAFNSGIPRMTKALTAKTWGKMRHMGISDNPPAGSMAPQAVIIMTWPLGRRQEGQRP